MTIVCVIGKAVCTVEVRIGCVRKRTIGVQHDSATHGSGDEFRCQRIPIGVRVIDEHAAHFSERFVFT